MPLSKSRIIIPLIHRLHVCLQKWRLFLTTTTLLLKTVATGEVDLLYSKDPTNIH